jgi:hypothetical protein
MNFLATSNNRELRSRRTISLNPQGNVIGSPAHVSPMMRIAAEQGASSLADPPILSDGQLLTFGW